MKDVLAAIGLLFVCSLALGVGTFGVVAWRARRDGRRFRDESQESDPAGHGTRIEPDRPWRHV